MNRVELQRSRETVKTLHAKYKSSRKKLVKLLLIDAKDSAPGGPNPKLVLRARECERIRADICRTCRLLLVENITWLEKQKILDVVKDVDPLLPSATIAGE
jgi:hypothetical protein